MSLDPRDLEVGNKVIFNGCYIKEVTHIDYDKMEIHFGNGDIIKIYSELWELTELENTSTPRFLNIAVLNNKGFYVLNNTSTPLSPVILLRMIKTDVERLESAGVKGEE